MKVLAVILTAFVSQLALANTNCEGIVPVPTFNHDADVGVDFEKLEPGQNMGLWAPITSDEDEYIVLKILSAETLADGAGLLVKTQYLMEEMSNLSFIYTQSADGSAHLQDFKGIEGGIEFGPGKLSCQ